MFPTTFNPILLSEASNLPIGVDLDRMVRRDNESYFNEALSFVLEMQKEYNSANIGFYRSVVESAGNEEIVQESFGDFFHKIMEIIQKFLKFIRSLFDKFLLGLNAFVKREKYIYKHENDLAKFTNIHEFRYTGYEYTFAPEIPRIEALAEFSDGFLFDLDSKSNSKGAINTYSADGLKNSLSALNNALESGTWYDKFRANVIGRDGDIVLKSDYASELFKTFRNEESSRDDFDVTASVVSATLMRFKGHESAISSARNTKDRIDSQYNSVRKQVENMLKINYKGGERVATIYGTDNVPTELSSEAITTMDLFVKAKTAQIQEMSTIHALAFSAKLDALNECFKQDKAVLYKALAKVQGSLGKEA